MTLLKWPSGRGPNNRVRRRSSAWAVRQVTAETAAPIATATSSSATSLSRRREAISLRATKRV